MATFTASEVNSMRAVHAGVNAVRAYFEGSVTTSEVILLAKIPHGATLLDWRITGGTAVDGGTGTWKIGFQGSVIDAISGNSLTDDSLHAGLSLTAGGCGGAYLANWSVSASIMVASRSRLNLPIKISVSDDAVNRFVWMQGLLTSASGTATTTMHIVVEYIMGD